VLYHRCGAGRKYKTKTPVPSCGEMKPHSTPHYHGNPRYPVNAEGNRVIIVCSTCKNEYQQRHVNKQSQYTAETPSDKAIIALAPEHANQFYDQEREMYSLTAMHKASGEAQHKSPSKWFDQVETGDFLAELNRQTIPAKDSLIETREGRNGGTWAHWQIAIAYAKYLSPAFHIQWNEYAAAYLRGEQRGATANTTPAAAREISVEERPTPPINEYARLLEHVTQTGESAITMRNHLTLTEQWLDSLPSVVAALEDYLTGLRPLAVAVQQRRNPLRHGWIYVLHDPAGRRYKIGMTQDPDPKKRKAGVEGQWGKGQSVQVVWIETDNIQLERVIHAYYKRRGAHLRDEWYRLSSDDVDRIRALGGFVRFRDFTPESLDVIAVVQSGFLSEEL